MADIKLSAGDDTYVQTETDRLLNNTVYGLEGNDVIRLYRGTAFGSKGDDRIERLIDPASPGASLTAAYWDAPVGVEVRLDQGFALDGHGGRDTLVGVSSVLGNGWNDTFVGDGADNRFGGNHGHDVIDGGAGDDVVDLWFKVAGGANVVARLDDVVIRVAADGQSASVLPRVPTGFSLTLTNVERLGVTLPSGERSTVRLGDFISPQVLAEDAIAAGSGWRWNAGSALGTPVALSFSFVSQPPADGPGANGFRAFAGAEQQAVRELLARTAQITGLSFTEVDEAAGQTGQLRFGVSSQAASKGLSWLPNQSGAGERAGDVWMDADSMPGLAPGTEGWVALLHEIGHALGLRHPRNTDPGDGWAVQLREQEDRSALTVMSGTLSADGLFRSDWGPLDVLALRHLYGSQPVAAGDDTYWLGAAASNAQTTLVDDGGVDTLDASALPTGVNLDLAPGRLSSAGLSAAGTVGVDNLALPATTWVESAVGSAFDDVLLGNDLDNWLKGGPGNDWVDGGKGIDTAVFAGRRADYEISNAFGKVYVKSRDGSGGFDTLGAVERLQFDDLAVALSSAVLSSDAQFALDEDGSLLQPLPAPTDVDRSAVSYRLAAAPSHGSATLSVQGTLSYQPAADYAGSDVVVYDVVGVGGSNRYLAHVSVLPVNDAAPVGRDGSYLVLTGAPQALRLPAATDADGDTLRYRLITDPGQGTVHVDPGGDFVYEARAGASGIDGFTFAVTDGMGGSSVYSARLRMATVRQTLEGTAAADAMPLTADAGRYVLLAGDDRASGGGGDDVIDGGPGTDTAAYSGRRADFSLSLSDGFWLVADRTGAEGVDTLLDIERLQFNDRQVALDLDGHGGQTAQIARALFGAAALKQPELCGYGLVLLDRGMSYPDLVSLALGTREFWLQAGDEAGRSNSAFVASVFRNVVGRSPSADEARHYVDLLDSGAFTQGTLGLLACQVDINTGSADLVGLAATGLDFIVPLGL